MDEKEIKRLLKNARDCIRKKEYEDAIKHVTAILKDDKDNYNALVFLGVAAEGTRALPTALNAYRKAIGVDDSQLLAWQGLCSVFEKSEGERDKKELTGVYQKLLNFHQKDASKKSDVRTKLIKLHEQLGQYDEAFSQVVQVLNALDSEDPAETLEVWQKLVKLSSRCTALKLDDKNMVAKGYGIVLKDASVGDVNQLVGDYLLFMCKTEDITAVKLTEECHRLKSKYPETTATTPFLAQIYLFAVICGVAVAGIGQVDVRKQADDEEEETMHQICLKAWEFFLNRNYADAKMLLLKGLQQDNSYFPACLMLAKVYLNQHDSAAAEKCLQTAKRLLGTKELCSFGVERKYLRCAVDLVEAEILLERADGASLHNVLKISEEWCAIDVKQKELLDLKARCLIRLNEIDDAIQVIKELEAISATSAACLEGLVFMKREDWNQAEQRFQCVLAEDGENAVALFNLGKLYWQLCKDGENYQDKCLAHLLKAAKADPNYHLCFLYLGQYYEHVQKDLNKGKKCYQKAYNLDRTHEETGVCLVDVLNTLGQEDSSLSILLSVTRTASAGSCKWAWLRLGLYQMKHDDPTKAIVSLQSALRADTKDYHCWECLGEAYLTRGSYTAACKAFTKATELEPAGIYSFYQIASIKLTLGMYSEAVVDFKKILEGSPDYVPALKGLGETYLLQAKQFLVHFFHGRAVDSCTEAFTCLTRAAHIRPGFSCLWKLLGDCCTVLHVVPSDMCIVSVPAILLGSERSLHDVTKLEKADLLALGSRCYGMALKSQPDCASLWHDLAVNFYQRAQTGDKLTSTGLMAKAFQAVEKALRHDGSNHKHWNLLGLVAQSKELDNKALAQHSFIKSIQVEQSNVVAWSNLGVLYLKDGDVKLAHEAFKVAQSLEPSYVASWIGQALIAETVGQSEEALDLFRHTTELCTHTEGALGYAHWVCQILQDNQRSQTNWNKYIIEHMHAVTAASDVLAKYTERIKTNPTAYNLYGLILERQKLYKSAVGAFERAVKILQQSSKDANEELRKAKLNLARVLVHTGDNSRAIVLFQEVGVAAFSDQCSFALALYKMASYGESYSQYTAALQNTSCEEDRSHVYAALGMIKYKMGLKETGRGDIDGAKTDLFKCIQSSPPSVYGLNGLLSLGLIEGDLTLAEAAVQELHQFVQEGGSTPGFTYMVASLHALKGELVHGRRALCKLIHAQPEQAAGWSYLVQYMLTHQTDLTHTVTRCCQIARQQDVRMQQKNLNMWLGLALLGTGQHSSTDRLYNSHSAAQKAVYLSPDNLESWVGLIAGMYAEMIVSRCLKKKQKLQNALLPLITHFMAKVESSLSQKEGNTPRLQALHLWCVKQYVVALLAADRRDQAEQFLQQALWLYEEDQPLQNLLAFLNQNLNTLKINAINDSQGLIRQMLVKLFLMHGLVDEAENTFKMWLPQARTKPRKVLAHVRLAYFAFQQFVCTGQNSEPLRAVFTEACEECLRIDHRNFIIHFLTGMLSLLDNKKKDCKKSLQNSLKFASDQMSVKYGKTLARKHLLKCLLEKGDEADIQALIMQARRDEDTEFLTYASKFVGTKD